MRNPQDDVFGKSVIGMGGVLEPQGHEGPGCAIAEEDARYEALFRIMDLSDGKVVLEPACGIGKITVRLAEHVGPKGKVISCDLALQMIRRLRSRELPECVYSLACSARSLPIAAGSCDAVVCFNSFHQFGDKAQCLREFNRVLDNRGSLWIVDFERSDLVSGLQWGAGGTFGGNPLPSRPSMISLLGQTGFKLRVLRDNPQGYILSAVKETE